MNIQANKNKWLIFFAAGIMIILANLDMTIVNLAIAKISAQLHSGMNQAQWIINSYLLATALAFIILGRLADAWGKRRIFLLGIFLFTIASLLAGLAENLPLLIIARTIQGIGFAATLGLSIILIVNSFPIAQQGFAAGMAITCTGLAQAIGPTIGGIILQYYDWHWIFLINVPLGCLSWLMTLTFVAKDNIAIKKWPLSNYNLLLFTSGLGILLFSINQLSFLDWRIVTSGIVLGCILLALFFKNCRHNPRGLLDFNLLGNSVYVLLLFIRFIFMFLMAAILFVMPLYLQNILGFAPIKTGLVLLSMTLPILLISPTTGKILDHINYVYLLVIAFLFALFSFILMFIFNTHINSLILNSSLIFFGLAIGIQTSSSIHGVLKSVPPEKSATAIGLFFTIAITGSVLGVALTGNILNSTSRWFLKNILTSYLVEPKLLAWQFDKLALVANGTQNIYQIKLPGFDIVAYKGVVFTAFMQAFYWQASLLCALALIALILCYQLSRKNRTLLN